MTNPTLTMPPSMVEHMIQLDTLPPQIYRRSSRSAARQGDAFWQMVGGDDVKPTRPASSTVYIAFYIKVGEPQR